MRITVTLLRENGFRVKTRARELTGQLVIEECRIREGMVRLAAEIKEPGASLGEGGRTLAVLFDPEIRCWHGATFKLNGWEIIDWKGDGRQLVIQEWACRVDGF